MKNLIWQMENDLLSSILNGRQVDFELRSMAGLAGEIDEPAMTSNYGADGRKPQSRPMTSLFGRKERGEDAVHDLARNADSGVGHGDEDISLRPGAFFVQIPVFSLDQKGAACGHRVAGVDAEIHQDLPDLRRVPDDAPEVIGGQ